VAGGTTVFHDLIQILSKSTKLVDCKDLSNAILPALSKASTVSHLPGNALQKVIQGLALGPFDSGLGGHASCDLERSGIAKSELQCMPPL
jgi:hypothetical protein